MQTHATNSANVKLCPKHKNTNNNTTLQNILLQYYKCNYNLNYKVNTLVNYRQQFYNKDSDWLIYTTTNSKRFKKGENLSITRII